MRLMEECPYITPCGWCSRQGKPCEVKEKKEKQRLIGTGGVKAGGIDGK